jgi:DNA/RNA-binding domain of Phe-tRNA-synthetase-like protein
MSALFTIQSEIWDRFPGMRLVVASGEGLDNSGPHAEIVAGLQAAAADLGAHWGYENAQSHPRVAAWREAMRRVGVSPKKCPSSIEALARRVLTGKAVSSINPLVDLYNTLSLRHVVPAGAWDLDTVSGGLRLGLTSGGERFTELGSEQTETVGEGEVSYLDDREVVTRHFVWRQSERGKVTQATRRFLFVSEVLPEAGETAPDEIRASLVDALRQHFSIDARAAVLRSPAGHW